jgi:hypothetical protein
MDFGTLLRILNLGTIGVAGVGLFFWYQSFQTIAKTPRMINGANGVALLQNLRYFLKIFVAALIASAVVQVVTLVVDKFVPDTKVPHHLLLNIKPEDVDNDALPTVSMNGKSLSPDPQHLMSYQFDVDHESDFEVDLLKMRDKLSRLDTQYRDSLKNAGNGIRNDSAPLQGFDTLK